MNVIQKAISDVMFNIPREVLQHALYIGRGPKQVDVTTLGSKIKSLVIRPRVLVDLNLASSNVKFIKIGNCIISEQDKYGMVITVPSDTMGGASIISPASISGSSGTGFVHTNLELIAENTVFAHDLQAVSPDSMLKCTVTYDANMTNIPPGAYKHISRFVIHAVKAYCHNELKIRLGQGAIYQGAELSGIKEEIDNYSTAEEDYREMQDKIIGKLLFMSNEPLMSEYTKMHFPR